VKSFRCGHGLAVHAFGRQQGKRNCRKLKRDAAISEWCSTTRGRYRVPIARSKMKGAMDMRDEWLRSLRSWASGNGNVRELWLFGSRAKSLCANVRDVACGLHAA
jgi:hypothetical protein